MLQEPKLSCYVHKWRLAGTAANTYFDRCMRTAGPQTPPQCQIPDAAQICGVPTHILSSHCALAAGQAIAGSTRSHGCLCSAACRRHQVGWAVVCLHGALAVTWPIKAKPCAGACCRYNWGKWSLEVPASDLWPDPSASSPCWLRTISHSAVLLACLRQSAIQTRVIGNLPSVHGKSACPQMQHGCIASCF